MKSQLLPANCLRVFDHFVGLALKRLILIHYHYKYMVRHDNSSIRNKDATENLLLLNLLVPNPPFSTPQKHQKPLRFSDVFRGLRKGALRKNGLIAYIKVASHQPISDQ